MAYDISKDVEESTNNSGILLKVQDAATINKLALLVSVAKRSRQTLDGNSNRLYSATGSVCKT